MALPFVRFEKKRRSEGVDAYKSFFTSWRISTAGLSSSQGVYLRQRFDSQLESQVASGGWSSWSLLETRSEALVSQIGAKFQDDDHNDSEESYLEGGETTDCSAQGECCLWWILLWQTSQFSTKMKQKVVMRNVFKLSV